jgi:hypothetical protein
MIQRGVGSNPLAGRGFAFFPFVFRAWRWRNWAAVDGVAVVRRGLRRRPAVDYVPRTRTGARAIEQGGEAGRNEPEYDNEDALQDSAARWRFGSPWWSRSHRKSAVDCGWIALVRVQIAPGFFAKASNLVRVVERARQRRDAFGRVGLFGSHGSVPER